MSFVPEVEKEAEGVNWKPTAKALYDNLSATFTQAIATGNFKGLGQAFLASITSVLIGSLFENIGKAIFGGAIAGTGHEGAFVPGPPSQESLWLLRGQEWVLTPEQMEGLRGSGGGVGVTINQRLVGDVDQATRRAMRSQAREQAILLENEREELGLA